MSDLQAIADRVLNSCTSSSIRSRGILHSGVTPS